MHDANGTSAPRARGVNGVTRVRSTTLAALFSVMTLAAADSVAAQGRGRGNDDRPRGNDDRGRAAQGIPPGHLPPPGECRVWYDNRPPGQQPPPTSCESARVTVARNGGRVIYGDVPGRAARGRDNDRRDNDRRADDRRDRECDEKDRRKGECGDVRGRDDDRRDEGRYPDRTRERNRDGYPDRTYPRTLPDMMWGLRYSRGERMDQVRPWTGDQSLRASYTDADRNGRPEVVTWTDGGGRIVQRWFDDNRDGRADRVALYQNDRIVRIIQ